MERREIRIASWQLALVVLGMAAFVVLGVFLTVTGGLAEKAAGVTSVAFFGGFGGYALYRKYKGYGRLVITDDGIEMTMFDPRLRLIPWADVESIGVATVARQEFTTIRLRRYASLIDSLTDQEVKSALRHFRSLRVMGQAVSVAGAANHERSADLDRFLSGSGDLRSLVEVMEFMRRTYGAEVLLSWAMRDRKAPAFAKYLEECRRAALSFRARSGPGSR